MEFVKVHGMVSSTSFGRKRVSFSNMEFGIIDDDCMFKTPLKRLCSLDSFPFTKKSETGDFFEEKSVLEDLHQELLIKILCGVDYDDLKRMFFLSKATREALRRNLFRVRKPGGSKCKGDFGGCNNGVETPNAPQRPRIPRFRLTAKKLNEISVDLFACDDVEGDSTKGGLFTEME